MTARILSTYRDYACRHAGACCRSGWSIPVEVSRYDALVEALATGRLTAPGNGAVAPLLPLPSRTEDYAGLLGICEDGTCAFLEGGLAAASAEAPRSACAVHRQVGHAALPVSCQQFPRLAVMRPASTAVSLSHYCPTAAALLFQGEDAPTIEQAPDAVLDQHVWEGLDLRDALPPLLRHDALFTWTAFARWEAFVVGVLGDRNRSLEQALGTIAAAAEGLRRWRLEDDPFDTFVEERLDAIRVQTHHATVPASRPSAADEAIQLVSQAIPPGVQQLFTPSEGPTFRHGEPLASEDVVLRRYLVARAWASWVAHESGGVRGYVRWLLVVLGTLRRCRATSLFDAIRHADLLLVHLASPAALSRALARLDRVPLEAATLLPNGACRPASSSAGRKDRVPVK